MTYHQPYRYEIVVGGDPIALETGGLAKLAGGAVTIQSGGAVILATATASKSPREGIDFFPLSVDFEEKIYAAGRIPGNFFRREGRPSTQAILTARLIDRPLRPLFPKGFRNDVQVICTAMSADEETPLDILAVNAASAALMISNVPWSGPVAAVRMGYIDNEFIINPTFPQMANSLLDLRLAGTSEGILMVEAGANELPESMILEAMKLGHEAMQPIIELQNKMREELGKEKMSFPVVQPNASLIDDVNALIKDQMVAIMKAGYSKTARGVALDALKSEMLEKLGEQHEDVKALKAAFEDVEKKVVRGLILDEGIRPDGRDSKTIRPISAAVNILPRTHGTGLFTRGETQVLTIATLGTPRDAQRMDNLTPEEDKRYIHHYNFPPFSTGETWPMRGPKRREIGHGALAERALEPVIPPQDQFPYTLRLVSEALSSNGSTSMASVCGSTLSLMDAGVPISAPVAGIAMGLISEGDVTTDEGRYVVLSDIQGMEDHLGDMDFKVAGTAKGVTALQMDIKINGLSYDLLGTALAQAHEGRNYILGKMLEAISEPRPELSSNAPRILTLQIDPEKIGKVIGPGGKMIRRIQTDYDVKVDIDEDGTVYIAGGLGAEKAREEIEMMTKDVEPGQIYTGKVVRIESYGAFVEILPGIDGMVHISQIADYRVPNIEDIVKLGDDLMVMVVDVDPGGKIRLSRQAVLEGWTPEEARAHDKKPSGGRGGRDRGGRDRGGRDRRSGGGRDRRGGSGQHR